MNTPMVQGEVGNHGEFGAATSAGSPKGTDMRVNVHLKSKAAEMLLEGVVDPPLVGDVLRAVRELGVKLAPVYPKSRSRRLKSEFVVEVPDAATAERVVDRLNHLDATTAVYVKPADELP